MANLKSFAFIIGLLLFVNFSFAQKQVVLLTFALEDTVKISSSGLEIHILQEGRLIEGRSGTPIPILSGTEMQVAFLSDKLSIPSLRKLVVYRDSVIFLKTDLLKEVTVTSKRYLVRQTLSGYEYNPKLDSLFYNKSILVALQRLPFMRLEMDVLSYKNNEPILFTINGKERPGITNWNDVLRKLKSKDIYKVEMITDVPTLVSNRGFTIIVNLLTADVNINGQSISAAVIADQRKNLNKNLDFTLLRRKSDYSASFNQIQDNITAKLQTSVFQNNSLINSNTLDSKEYFRLNPISIKYGLRIDSTKDLAASIQTQDNKNTTAYSRTGINLTSLYNQTNLLNKNKASINLSFLHRKTKTINRYLALTVNNEQTRLSNRVSFVEKRSFDSVHHYSKTLPRSISVEYNHSDNTNKNTRYEYGIQSYIRITKQDYSRYNLSTITNQNSALLYQRLDTLSIKQMSLSPYVKITRNFSARQNLIFRINSEFYSFQNKNSLSNSFALPSINISHKNILKKNGAVTLSSGLNFYKPGIDFLIPVQAVNNPILKRIGNSNLIPSKTAYLGVNLSIAQKANITHSLVVQHTFDKTIFFTEFDSSEKKFIQKPDNNNSSNGIQYSLDFEQQVLKKIAFYTYAQIDFSIYKNRLYRTRNSGIGFSITNSLAYPLGIKWGSIGLRTFINGSDYTSQGRTEGTINYSFYYAKSFFKNSIALTLIANEFLKSTRNFTTFSENQNVKQYAVEERPLRLMALRVAYNFSNIRLNKTATEKKAIIRGEVNSK